MSILDYFNKKKLLNPKGTLSRLIPIHAITCTNEEVEATWTSEQIKATAAAKTPNYTKHALIHRNMYMYTPFTQSYERSYNLCDLLTTWTLFLRQLATAKICVTVF